MNNTDKQERKPMVDGMYTRHPDYKHGKVKLSDSEKEKLQNFQKTRVASKRQVEAQARAILKSR